MKTFISTILLFSIGLVTVAMANGLMQIKSITGPTSFILENGSRVELDLVTVPMLLGEKSQSGNVRRNEQVRRWVESLFKDQQAIFTASQRSPDRFGSLKGIVKFKGVDDVGLRLLQDGLVSLRHPQADHPLWSTYLESEDTARNAKVGLWADRNFAPACEDNAQYKASRYAIIAGDIENISIQRDVIYINFTSNWREDFTVRIEGRGRKRLFESLQNTLVEGQWIEVRGWVSWTNGPMIDLTSPYQVRGLQGRPDYCQD